MISRCGDTLGIYIHYPFCVEKCDYCDFYSLPSGRYDSDLRGETKYLKALEAEFHHRLQHFRKYDTVDSIYFGGGTASLLSSKTVAKILKLIAGEYAIHESCEITLEGNPEQLTPGYLDELKNSGINRINAGIQTFHEKYLTHMGRYHNPKRYERILEDLASISIRRWGVDLIYGFPGQMESEFLDDLQKVLNSNPSHISLYALTAEAGTPYTRKIDQNYSFPPEEELQHKIFCELPDLMKEANYNHYEISNYAKPGEESRHNLRYWLYEPCMGLGPSAHGFDGAYRYGNERDVIRWLSDPASAERMSHEPAQDIPIGLLRITDEIPVSVVEGIIREQFSENETRVLENVQNLFHRWHEKGYSDVIRNHFRWRRDGYLFLEDRIYEMSEAMDSAG